jgi:hypothetical protein
MIRRKLLFGGLLVVVSLAIAVVAGRAQASPVGGVHNPNGVVPRAAAPSIPTPSSTIFSNLGVGGAYNEAGWWCVTDVLSAPDFGCGKPFTTANGFVGNGSRVTQIDVALGWDKGSNNATVKLAADDGSGGGVFGFGLPGQILGSWSVASQPPIGSCCVVTTVRISPSIPVGAGKRYWVIVAPGPSFFHTTSDGWNFNVFDAGGPVAQDNGAGFFGFNNVQGAFDVLSCSKLCKVT